jgi:hypothetical protein
MSAWSKKELRGDILARCTAREIFNAMSKGIVDNARTAGRSGGPAFIRNWRNFQTDSQYRGEGVFRSMLSNATLCDYFSDDVKGLFGATQKSAQPRNTRVGNLDPYALRTNCTMPSGFNLTAYQKDFSGNGGWDAWTRMLEPQNNYYGTLFQSLGEVNRQRSLEESSDLNQAIANKGFTGKSGKNANDSCKTKDANGRCIEYKDIKTPGTVISDSVAATVQQELAWITNVHDVGEVISAATEVLLNRLIDFSNPNEGDYMSYDEPQLPDSPPEDGGGGACSDPGNSTANYAGDLRDAENAVISNNPNLADSLNDIPNSEAFIGLVVSQLISNSFQASGNVLNGNGVPHPENYVAIWQSGDSVMERYEAVNHAGDGDMTIREAAQTDFSGDIPLSCTGGGNQ